MSRNELQINTAPLATVIRHYRWPLSILVVVTGLVVSSYMSQLIGVYFPDRQPIFDTLFSVLPYWPWLQYWSDIVFVFSIALLGGSIYPKQFHKLPFIFMVIGLAYFLRGLFVFMNPFGGPLGNIAQYGITDIHQFGQFPSGHTLIVVLAYFLIDGYAHPLFKRLALLSVFVEVLALLLSHGHYSIDIVGGFLVGYFAYHVLRPAQKVLEV